MTRSRTGSLFLRSYGTFICYPHPAFTGAFPDTFSAPYIPKGTSGIFFAVAEPDLPRTRKFKLTAPDGKVLFDGDAPGGYLATEGKSWIEATVGFSQPGLYDGKLLKLDVSDGPNDYLVKVTLQQPRKAPFAEYVGMGSLAVFAPDEKTAMAIQGGTFVEDELVFWHAFQARFHRWLNAHKLDANDQEKALRAELESLFNAYRLIETSDGRGCSSWTNWGYGFGYYGCKVWRPSWLLMQRSDVPQELKAILREGLILGGDRLSFAVGMERVNGNAFAQIPVALWYCHQATGDALQKQRFETFWERWTSEGWGLGSGLSKSGDSQEHFAHDMHYGSYIMENWAGGTWVPDGILSDAKQDPRFQQVIDRYRDLYTFLNCLEQNRTPVAANPWSARTHASTHAHTKNWLRDGRQWQGDPGPDLTRDVGGGHEWFAARRKNYYMLTFHGRIAPEWMCETFEGQLGFSGGVICQLTVPGKGPVLASTLTESYGKGMHASNWLNFHIHSIVGEMWDGRPLVAAISEHDNARLEGAVVSGSGEVQNAHVKCTRRYEFQPDGIECQASLAKSDYAQVLSIWAHDRNWSEVKAAYEMLPYIAQTPDGKPTTVKLLDAAGKDVADVTVNATVAPGLRIDRGGFGVTVQLDQPRKIKLGPNSTVLIQIGESDKKFIPAEQILVKYRLVPYGSN